MYNAPKMHAKNQRNGERKRLKKIMIEQVNIEQHWNKYKFMRFCGLFNLHKRLQS